jgi:isopenicillin N synthase-like dioxygenase
MANTVSQIPVIDISTFLTGTALEREALARQVDETNRSVGFLLISGHGVPREQIDEMFAVSQQFFESPLAVRSAVQAPVGQHHGYHPMAASGLAAKEGAAALPDLREYFMAGRMDLDHPSFGTEQGQLFHRPNQWPSELAAFRTATQAYYRTMEALGAVLMRLFAQALKVDEYWFDTRIDHHFSILSSVYYPAQSNAPEPGQLRAGAHTDYGALTILAPTDAPGGLQIMDYSGQWIDVPFRSDAFVINLGDMMQRWTNDRWRSTPHRVVNPPEALRTIGPRQSLAYFLHPNHDAVIEAIPGCVPLGETPKYPPILAGEYMREREARIEGASAAIGSATTIATNTAATTATNTATNTDKTTSMESPR